MSHKQARYCKAYLVIWKLVTRKSRRRINFEADPLSLVCPAQVDTRQLQTEILHHRHATRGYVVGNFTRLHASGAVPVVNSFRQHARHKNLLADYMDAVINPWHPALELGGTPPQIRHPALVFVAKPVDNAPLPAD